MRNTIVLQNIFESIEFKMIDGNSMTQNTTDV